MTRLTMEQVEEYKKINAYWKVDLPMFRNALETIESMRQEIQQLDKDRTEAQSLWGEACTDILQLQQEIERLRTQMVQAARGSAEIVDLAEENIRLQQEISGKDTSNQNLYDLNKRLIDENNDLRKELQQLKAEAEKIPTVCHYECDRKCLYHPDMCPTICPLCPGKNP